MSHPTSIVAPSYEVRGIIRLADGSPAPGLAVHAVDRDLRSEQPLGQAVTGQDGSYVIRYGSAFAYHSEQGTADLVVRVLGADGALLAASPTLFNAPLSAVVDVTIPATALQPPSEFDTVAALLTPLLDGATIVDLEEDAKHQDVSFLAGETSLDRTLIGRFLLAHRLTTRELPAQFWFAILGRGFYAWTDGQSVAAQLAAVSRALSSLDAAAVSESLARAIAQGDIGASFASQQQGWVDAFATYVAQRLVQPTDGPSFLQAALDLARVDGAAAREVVARRYVAQRALTPDAIAALQKDGTLTAAQATDLQATFRVAAVTDGASDLVREIRNRFGVNRPEDVPALAAHPEDEWVRLVSAGVAAGRLTIPVQVPNVPGAPSFPTAEVWARTLARQVASTFPTAAFAGALQRAIQSGAPTGLRYATHLSGFLGRHPDFDLVRTGIDDFLARQTGPLDAPLVRDSGFRLELKAVQRVHKLTGDFDATAALLADGLHSARQIYRLGESEFVRRYGGRGAFTADDAQRAWRRAADTHAAVVTIIGDLHAVGGAALPRVLQHGISDLENFPNWQTLFRNGDSCACDECDSVLGPAAYFTDLLMFLKDRATRTPGRSVQDLLFARRPDLGWLELDCDNALTPLPYIDVVNEVLEAAVAGSAGDSELTGLTAIPADPAAAMTAVAAALAAAQLDVGDVLSVSQVDQADPDHWVAHGTRATFLLAKDGAPDFHASLLRNTKGDAAELRAYPHYVNAAAYELLRQARHPFALPFDLFGEQVRASFAKSGLRRWELMRCLTSAAGPSEADVAAEYFGISVDAAAPIDEKRLIVVADPTVATQQAAWGENGNAAWLLDLASVPTFLAKTGLAYRDLGALLDLPFINPARDITIGYLDASCDLAQQVIQGLDAVKLDRIHRFLRLWRKLDGWAMWEVDLAIRCAGVGAGNLDEACLVNLFHLDRLRVRLGAGATIEQLCALLEPLETGGHFVDFLAPRAEGLYQSVFLDRRVVQPLDPALAVAAVDVPAPTTEKISGHRPAILAALGVSQPDLDLLAALPPLGDDLTLGNLTLLWRHSWLAKRLGLSVRDWVAVLGLLQQGAPVFAGARDARDFIERVDRLRATGFTVDQLRWILAADRSARAATRESDAARFLGTLRTGLRAIQAQYAAAQYPFLDPPADTARLEGLLSTLLQQLHRDDDGARFFLDTLGDDVSLTAVVSGLPTGFTFPAAIAGAIPIAYDPAAGVLRFRGLMTTAQRATLLGDPSLAAVTGIASYQAAVAELFDTPRLALKFLDPVFTAPLAELPPAIDLASLAPPLARKISYDADARALRLVGILSPSERDALLVLSSDAAWQSAVSTLYTQPVTGTFGADVLWLADADLAFPLRNANDPAADNLNRNLATAIAKALVYLSRTLSESLVVQQASTALGLSAALTRHLLGDYAVLPPAGTLLAHLAGPFAASDGAVDYATMQPVFDGWFWAARVALAWKQWKLAPDESDRIRSLTTPARLLDPTSLPLVAGSGVPPTDTFVRTARLLALRDALPEPELTLLELLENLSAGQYATAGDFAADVVHVNDLWAADDVVALVGAIDLAYPADYLLAESWERVRQAFSFARTLNAGIPTLTTLAGPTMGASQAATVTGLMRSRLDAESWRQLSEQIQDALRERKRDALTAYLLSQPAPADAPTVGWSKPDDLYAYYLLDVEMSACQLTSRLVQASGSVQLLVQRCFMGLEPEVSVAGDDAWSWWTWMSKYRVWEANRQIFLWPENWIQPELRRDASPFFEELEQELQQGDVTADSARTAFADYLEKVDGVSQLEVAGFYQQDDGDAPVLHVFARTAGADPRVHWYRRFDYHRWTPWEKVDVDIQGDYLIPAVIEDRLFLFWPVFSDVPDEQRNATVQTPSASSTAGMQRTQKQRKVQLAMSEYRQGKWTPKKVSRDSVTSAWFPTSLDTVPKFYQFVPVDMTAVDGNFFVAFDGWSLASDGSAQLPLGGAFAIGGCRGIPEVGEGMLGTFQPAVRPDWSSVGEYDMPRDLSYPSFGSWCELGRADEFGHATARHDAGDDFTLENTFAFGTAARYTTILQQTPGYFRMTPPWQPSAFDRLVFDPPVATEGAAMALAPGSIVVNVPGGLGPRVPFGSWLPFFYNDQKRTFFVLPALSPSFGGVVVPGNLVFEYYPGIGRAVGRLEGQYASQVQSWTAALPLATFTPAQRQDLDQFLRNAFPNEAPAPLPGGSPPPYTPAEAERAQGFVQRHVMRAFHQDLGAQALRLYQGRRFHFQPFYHPFTCAFAKLVQDPLLGIPALMRRETQLQDSGFSFRQQYQPTAAVVDPSTEAYYPHEEVDFSLDGAYSPYNWELFFHAPLLIADALSRNQRFEEARDWYHYIFDPMGVESAVPGGSAMSKYWITKPFYQTTDPRYVQQRIENLLRMLAGDTTVPGYSLSAVQALQEQVRDWREHPFDPHRIASYRTVAYQKTVVMKYLDNLIAWGDTLFRQDSMESINEATQLYILAAELLGPRPQTVPPRARPPLRTFREVASSLDAFSDALVQVENLVPPQSGNGGGGAGQPPVPMLYFCVPANDTLLGYWDTVADRLYKIRHCMNIEGVVRQLALFEPPIDPASLVKSAALGADLGSVLADQTAPLPLYRFPVLLQKANEACADVKALGGALLAALEAQDAEALARLRQGQEIALLQAVRAVKAQQVDEAQANVEAARQALAMAQQKQAYYASREAVSAGEALALALSTYSAELSTAVQLQYALAAATRTAVPQFTTGGAGFGGSPVWTITDGGDTVANAGVDAGQVVNAIAGALEKAAAIVGTVAGYQRRKDDWDFQRDLAATEIQQATQAVAAAELRLASASKDLENQDLQIADSQAVDAFMRSKFTSLELFQWQVGQLSQVYFRSYQLAYDLARRAERCFRFELGLGDSGYVTFGYWDSLKRGLLAGEQLQADLRRLEAAYLDQNRREFELTKHVSLRQLDPLALVQLRETGRCFFTIPEELFDLDYPGQYFRRIKSVSLTLPSITGPYTTVSCTLRLLRNSIRATTDPGSQYERNTDSSGLPADDARFVEQSLPVSAIAASGAQNDSGLFTLDFRDERYLPFEGAGAISGWSLELFNDATQPDFGAPLRQFDYSTITDAVLHVKYTAREDAGTLKASAIAHLREYFANAAPAPALLMLNLRRDFPTQWSRFLNPTDPAQGNVFELEMSSALFPTRDAGKTLTVARLWLLGRCADPGSYTVTLTPPLPAPPPAGSNTVGLTPNAAYGGLHVGTRDVSTDAVQVMPNGPDGVWRLVVSRPGGGNLTVDSTTGESEMQDLLLVVSYAWG